MDESEKLRDVAMPRDENEVRAFFWGLESMAGIKGKALSERKTWHHRLRIASRIDPVAAYNLGSLFMNSVSNSRPRLHREHSAMKMFERAAFGGMERLADATAPFASAPRTESQLRDVVSCALTNIGTQVANAGSPETAVAFFVRSIVMYSANGNAHACLGNMAIFHHALTGLDPLEGILHWTEASRLGEHCITGQSECNCRAHITGIVRQIVSDYGREHAREWVLRFAAAVSHKDTSDFRPIAATCQDMKRLTGTAFSSRLAKACRAAGDELSEVADMAPEEKVTVAVSALATACRIQGFRRTLHDPEVARMIRVSSSVEPLHAFLSDADWRDISPTGELSLGSSQSQALIGPIARVVVESMLAASPLVTPGEMVAAILFHLDRKFRSSVVNMAAAALSLAPPSATFLYVPVAFTAKPVLH